MPPAHVLQRQTVGSSSCLPLLHSACHCVQQHSRMRILPGRGVLAARTQLPGRLGSRCATPAAWGTCLSSRASRALRSRAARSRSPGFCAAACCCWPPFFLHQQCGGHCCSGAPAARYSGAGRGRSCSSAAHKGRSTDQKLTYSLGGAGRGGFAGRRLLGVRPSSSCCHQRRPSPRRCRLHLLLTPWLLLHVR